MMFNINAIGEKIVVGVITAIIMTMLLLIWNWTSKGGLIHALNGITLEEANRKFATVDEGVKTSGDQLLEKIAALESDVKSLRGSLQNSSDAAAGEVSSGSTAAQMDQLHKKYQQAACPKGQYVAAVKAWGATAGGGIGDLTGVQVFCRPVLP